MLRRRKSESKPAKQGKPNPRLGEETPCRAVRWITKPKNAAVARGTGGRGCAMYNILRCDESLLRVQTVVGFIIHCRKESFTAKMKLARHRLVSCST
jgi:hypothetical protein